MKIAVITHGNHYSLGGVENYANLMYQYFSSKFEITEFPTLNIKKNQTNNLLQNPQVKIDNSLLGWKPHLIVWGGTYSNKNYQKIFNHFDIVIISTLFLPRKWLSHPKVILVQHMDAKWYNIKNKTNLIGWGQWLNHLLFKVGTLNNPFLNVRHSVFFSLETSASTNGKAWFIPLAHTFIDKINYIEKTVVKDLVWISRLDQSQKNLKAAVNLANLHPEIKIYGTGYSFKIIKRHLNNQQQYLGCLSRHLIDQTLSQARALLITSFWEGLPFTAIEALSNGTPIIMFNTFSSAEFLAKSGAVFLVEANDLQQFSQKIKWLNNLSTQQYQTISNQAIEFAKEHFSKEKFWNRWEQVLNYVETQ